MTDKKPKRIVKQPAVLPSPPRLKLIKKAVAEVARERNVAKAAR